MVVASSARRSGRSASIRASTLVKIAQSGLSLETIPPSETLPASFEKAANQCSALFTCGGAHQSQRQNHCRGASSAYSGRRGPCIRPLGAAAMILGVRIVGAGEGGGEAEKAASQWSALFTCGGAPQSQNPI